MSRNIEKHKEAKHQWYLNNKEKTAAATKKSKPVFKRNRALWMQEIKSELTCKECGETRFPCLEFHHPDPKEKDFNIGWAVYHFSKERILEEIKKCDVFCRNCHAMYHWNQKYGEVPESGNGPVC